MAEMSEPAQFKEPTVVDDGELIQQSRSGDLRAFEALYDRYKSQVYRAVLAITGDAVSAEDILQETFLRLHANIDRVDGSTPISPWLHRVAVNLAYNHVARNRRRASPLSSLLDLLVAGASSGPVRHVERAETNNAVQAAIASLSISHRLVVTLFYLCDFSLEEIAYILDCPVGTVKSRLYYARNQLRTQLSSEFGALGEVPA